MDRLNTITVVGGGIAGHMSAAALAKILPHDIEIIHIITNQEKAQDIFYGTVTTPTIYKFLLSIGVSEPNILLGSQTTFSFGTHYNRWCGKSWLQSFHQPLPVFDGVDIHHQLLRHSQETNQAFSLEPYIMSVQAAYHGVFAHPPDERKTPLADAEYGYHFLPMEWTDLFSKHPAKERVKSIVGEIETVNSNGENTASILLNDGRLIQADLYIDCTAKGSIIGRYVRWSESQMLRAEESLTPKKAPKMPCRLLKGEENGWSSKTPLRDHIHALKVYTPESYSPQANTDKPDISQTSQVMTGYRKLAWIGNNVAIGHAAAVLDPLTPAPMTLLHHSITRLLELVPVSKAMNVERKEYNRRFIDDYTHSSIFQRAFFETDNQPHSVYWRTASEEPLGEKLTSKINQFKSRGICVQYDYEPFNIQDWTMLHIGLGNIPKRYDRLAERVPLSQIENSLNRMRDAITAMAKKMPPHDIYVSKLLAYLEEKHGQLGK